MEEVNFNLHERNIFRIFYVSSLRVRISCCIIADF